MKKIFVFSIIVFCFAFSLMAQEGKMVTPEKDNPIICIETSMGKIYAELFPKNAPQTVKNFLDLATGNKEYTDPNTGKTVKAPYYDGVIFHRVIPDFMIQTGDLTGTGRGGPGYKFNDEINADSLGLGEQLVKDTAFLMNMYPPYILEKYLDKSVKAFYETQGYHYINTIKSVRALAGVLAMANAGPDTNGSQFFINEIDTPWLDGKHTVFGRVIRGMNIVKNIARVRADNNNKPLSPVKIISIKVVDSYPEE